jgi:hypothetical protein
MLQLRITSSALVGVALMVLGLWAWQLGPHWVFDAERPGAALWAVRLGAISAGALGEAFVLLGVIGNVYRARPIDVAARVMAACVFVAGLVGFVALGLVAR